MPSGGMVPPWILRTTFSQVSAPSPTCATSSLSSINPPVFSFWLWQVTQYLSSRARSAGGGRTDGAATGVWGAADKTSEKTRAPGMRTRERKVPPAIVDFDMFMLSNDLLLY